MMPGFMPFPQRPQKDPEVGAYRCKSCGVLMFREAWHCDDCRAASMKEVRTVLKVGALVAAVATILGVLLWQAIR